MRIRTIRCYRQEQPFRDGPYVVSGARSSLGFDSLIVAIESSEGLTGWGEMSPLGATYDPAFPEGARAAAPLLADALMGQNPAEVGKLANLMDRTLKGHAYAKSAFDMALWDLAGKRAGLPLAELLGGRYGQSVELYRSISQAEPKAMAERARKYQAEGYRRLQVKVGGNPDEDAARLFAVAEALPPGFVLYCDANGGWRRGDALSFLRLTRGASYVMEQPCQSYEDNLALRPFCDRPLVLDESIVDQASLLRAAGDGVVDGITIKIARVGGITRAHHLREIAVGLRLAVTVEDTGGAEIDTAAMAHLSLSTPEACRAHTVDFHNWVTVSNADGLPACREGRMQAPLGPGLGLTIKHDHLGPPILELFA